MGTDSDRKSVQVLAPSAEKAKDKESEEEKKKRLAKAKKKKATEEDDMSEEDKKKKEELEALVAKLVDTASSEETILAALETIASELREATSSMTSVPKPLKFLRPHFDELEKSFKKLNESHNKRYFADILSVLGTTISAASVAKAQAAAAASAAAAGDEAAKGTATTADDKAKDKSKDESEGTAEETPKRRRKQLCLYYRLQGGVTPLTSWGHEFLRNLSGEIAAEYAEIQRRTVDESTEEDASGGGEKTAKDEDDTPLRTGATLQDLHAMVDEIVPFNMKRSAETDAMDLLAEVETPDKIAPHVEKANYKRVVNYLTSLAEYSATTDEFEKTLTVAFDILLKQEQYGEALVLALRLDHSSKINAVVRSCTDYLRLKQLAMVCFRQRMSVDWDSIVASLHEDGTIDFGSDSVETVTDELKKLSGGEWLSSHFLALAQELDVLEPKLPENIYKTHLEEHRIETVSVDSAKKNLAATFVNGFVNAAFCNDSLMSPDDSAWLYKNKDHGMLSAAASLGLVNLWNVNGGLEKVDKLQYSKDVNVSAGALVAFGLFNATVKNEWDPAYVLLNDKLRDTSSLERQGAVLGLGLAYAATRREDLMDCLVPVVIDMSNTIELSATAALSLGLIFAGSCNETVAEVLVQALIDRNAAAPPQPAQSTGDEPIDVVLMHHICVGLGLVFLRQKDACEATLLALEAVAGPMGAYAAVTVEGMAFAASGEVLKMQRMLRVCVENQPSNDDSPPDSPTSEGAAEGQTSASAEQTAAGGSDKAEDEWFGGTAASTPASSDSGSAKAESHMDQAAAVLNLPLIAMCEATGAEMVLRLLEHLLQYASLPMRRAVPLALALHSVSTPKPSVIDSLSKLSHDADADVALHAILALGIIGAGTNNSRIAGLLRQLAAYYGKDANALFTVRIAQGLLYLGKGLMTLSPVHSDSSLVDPAALGSLLVVLHVCLNLRKTILARHHFLLYFLVPAIFPRMLITLDEDLQPLPVAVRVGQAVDVVGQAGHPKTITGFQTHTTPVLLSSGERAELAVDDYEPMTPILEGVVILRRRTEPQSSAARTATEHSATAAGGAANSSGSK